MIEGDLFGNYIGVQQLEWLVKKYIPKAPKLFTLGKFHNQPPFGQRISYQIHEILFDGYKQITNWDQKQIDFCSTYLK